MTAVLSAGQDHHFNTLHMYPSSPSSPSRTSDATDWKAKYYAVEEMLQETRNELDEFQQSSKELEDELERELERTEKAQEDLKNKVAKAEQERDDWMAKFMGLQQTHNTTTNSLQRELEAFRQREAIFKVQLRELELGNDDLERNERQASSSLADVEAKYARALEEKILLEHELQDKASLEETCQRLRDELRDVNLEVTVLKEQLVKPPPSPSPRPRIAHASTASFELPTLKGDSDSLLHSPPPDLLFNDIGAVPPRAGTASETSSIHSRLSREFTGSNSTAPSSVASSTFGIRIRATPTPASILNRALSPSAASAPGGSRLPRRNVTTPLPTSPQTPRVIPSRKPSTAALPRSKQMVSEMRARVRTLEQKIHSNMPRLRVGGSQQGNPRVPQAAASRMANKENASVLDSPGWVLVTEDGDQVPASPLHRSHAPALPPLDFTKPSLGSLTRTGSALGRLGRTSPQRSVTLNPRTLSPMTSELGHRVFPSSPSKAHINDREGSSRPPTRIAVFSGVSALSPPSPSDKDPRPSTPPQPSRAAVSSSSPRKSSPPKPPTTQLGNRRRGSAGGGTTSHPNIANAGATPGRPQRRNVTTPATPPPPLPSFRPIAKTMTAADSSLGAVHSALARARMPPPRVASAGEMTKSRIGKPKFVSRMAQ